MTESKAHLYQPAGGRDRRGARYCPFPSGPFSRDLRVRDGSSVYGLWLDAKAKIRG